jgi:diguanylate cyclase (GGDEF)-like protein
MTMNDLPQARRLLVRNAGFAIVFVLAIVAGRASRIDESEISLVWPAAAVSAVWMLSVRARTETVVSGVVLWVCAFLTTYLDGLSAGLSIGTAFVSLIGGGGTAYLFRRRVGARLSEPWDLGWLVISVATATGLGALLGGVLRLVLLDGDLWSSTFILWTRNGVTTLLGVALLATFPRELRPPRWPTRRRLLGDVVIWAFAVAVYALVFVVNVDAPLAYFVLPVAVVIGLRWSTPIGVWHMLASGIFVLLATFAQRGPFAHGDAVVRAALAQGLIGCALLVVLTVALYRDSRARLLDDLEAAHHETRRAAERLRHSSLHDPLTGLANRQRLMQVLADEVAEAQGSETRVGVIFLDLDGFKAVNDTFGHAEGDRLLDAVATRLRMLLRPADAVARLGGDEFVMVCPGLSLRSQLEAIAARVATTLSMPYELMSGHTHGEVSASVGTALSTHDSSADQLIRDADTAMYAAKRSRKLRGAGAPS